METTITLSNGTVSALLDADASCSTCNGTGYDPDFKCTCTCRIETLRGRSRWINAVGVQGDVARHTHGNGSGSGRSSQQRSSGATEKQQAFYGKLLSEAIEAAGNDDRAMGSVNGVNERWQEARTVSQASAAIDAMLSLIKQIKAAARTSAPAAPAQSAARTNKYDARCESCHKTVEAGTGALERVDGKWIVKHVGECPEGDKLVHAEDGLEHEGTLRFALRNDDGTVKFYRVDKPSKGKWAGFTFLSVQASDNDFPIRDKATKDAVLARIAEDPQAAMALYGQEIGRCGHCNRTLTSEWREQGIGPVCSQKMGF